MRPVTRLAVFGLAVAALLGGGQSAKAQLVLSFFNTSDNLTGSNPPAYGGELVRITLTQESATQIGVQTQVIATALQAPGLSVEGSGINLVASAGAALTSITYSSGVVANYAGFDSTNSLNGGSLAAATAFNTVWDWPPPGTTILNTTNTSSKYIMTFSAATALTPSLLTSNGNGFNGGSIAGVRILGYEGTGGQGNVTLGVSQFYNVPEPASIIAGLLGLPCVGGVVSLVRRRVGGGVVA